MNDSRSPDQLRVERLASLCRQADRDLEAAATTRANAADPFELLKYATAHTTRLCDEVDKFLPMAPPLKQQAQRIRKRSNGR